MLHASARPIHRLEEGTEGEEATMVWVKASGKALGKQCECAGGGGT